MFGKKQTSLVEDYFASRFLLTQAVSFEGPLECHTVHF